jgi:hypothetical protein
MDIKRITAATPIITPNIVNADLTLFETNAIYAVLKISEINILYD